MKSPAHTASELRLIADKIDASKHPSRQLVARALRRVVAAVNLTSVKEVPSDDGIAFLVDGDVDGEQFQVKIGISPEERLWDLEAGAFPEGSDAEVVGEIFEHPIVQAAVDGAFSP